MRSSLVKPLNYKLHGAVLGLSAVMGLYAFTQSSRVFAVWGERKSERIALENDVQAKEDQAMRIQAAIDNNINLFDSVTLSEYTCDPANPPRFNVAAFVQPDQQVKVADQNQRVIGYIAPGNTGGQFHFHAGNCNGPTL